jgi:3-methylcrotonyl-CoA carboxylase beta subunit
MGGDQAASVLTTVGKAGGGEAGGRESAETAIREQYETQGSPYYSTARLWDDGVIDPVDTRRVLGLALSAAANAPLDDAGYGIFRM